MITNPGSGYTVAPTLQVTGGGGSGAAGTVFIGDGALLVSLHLLTQVLDTLQHLV